MKQVSKLLALIVALCMVLSVAAFASAEPSAEPASAEPAAAGGSVQDAFIEYIHQWLLAELAVNSNMTIEQVEDEFMPLVKQMNFVDFPAEMIYSGMLEQGVPMTYDEFAAQYTPAAGGASAEPASGEASAAPAAAGYTADYAGWLQYLKDYVSAVPAAQEHLDEFFAAIDNGEFYTMPGDMLFQDTFWGYSAATYDEFVAAGGQVQIPAFDPNLTPD